MGITVCMKLLVSCQSPFKFRSSILPTLGALMLYVIAIGCISYMPPFPDWQPCMNGMIIDFLQNTDALIASAAAPVLIISLDVIFVTTKRRIYPTALDLVQAAIKSGQDVPG